MDYNAFRFARLLVYRTLVARAAAHDSLAAAHVFKTHVLLRNVTYGKCCFCCFFG